MLNRSRAFRTRKRNSWGSATLSLFILLVSLAVIGRMLQVDLVYTSFCDVELFRGTAPSSSTVSPVEWIIIAIGLALVAQLCLAISGAFQKSFQRGDALVGGINVVMALLLLSFWSQFWAWWHPLNPVGEWVSRTALSTPFGRPRGIWLEPYEFREQDELVWTELDVQQNGEPVYRHDGTGVTRAYEPVYACQPDEIFRANVRLMVETGRLSPDAYSDDMSDTEFDWIYRDADGHLMGAKQAGLWFGADPVGRSLRKQAEEASPSMTLKEFQKLVYEESRQRERPAEAEPVMSLEDFTELYICSLESGQSSEYRSCRLDD